MISLKIKSIKQDETFTKRKPQQDEEELIISLTDAFYTYGYITPIQFLQELVQIRHLTVSPTPDMACTEEENRDDPDVSAHLHSQRFFSFKFPTELNAESTEEDYWDREDLFDKQYPMVTMKKTLHFRPNISGNHSGCLLWDTSRELADYLETSCVKINWVRGKSVLELGAGLGCAGIAAACLGGNVTATDLPETITYLQDSINRNLENIKGTGGEIRAEILRWGDKKKIRSMPRYDIILMSDVIYEEDDIYPLISTLVHLSHENTTLLMCQQRWLEGTVKEIVWKTFFFRASKCFKFSELRAKGRFIKDPCDVWLLKGEVLMVL